jgi:hypothetical protein
MMAATVYAQAGASPESQTEKREEPRSLTGTWVILLEGHQVGLEVEDKAGTLEGTLYIMGQRVPVDGTVKDGAVKMKISGQHRPDDTLEGEIDLPRGPMKWTAERLKKP